MPVTKPHKAKTSEIAYIGSRLKTLGEKLSNFADQLDDLGIEEFVMTNGSQKTKVVDYAEKTAKAVHKIVCDATDPTADSAD